MTDCQYHIDVLFNKHGKDEWTPYGVPGEPPQGWDKRLDALTTAKRFAAQYNRRCRIRGGDVVHGYVEPDGTVSNATKRTDVSNLTAR